jgi:hypothetical protein
MFSHTFRRTILCATIALTLLVPAAQADDWAADRATEGRTGLDPAIATAIFESKNAASQQVALDPAIRTALLQAGPRTSRIADGRSLDTVEAARLARFETPLAGLAPVDRFHWDDFGIGVGSAFGSVMLLAGFAAGVLATRRRRDVTGSAAS